MPDASLSGTARLRSSKGPARRRGRTDPPDEAVRRIAQGPRRPKFSAMAGQVAELEAYRSGARALAARILSAQEAERVRISRELHDDTGQALTLILVRLQLIENLTRDADVRRELAELRELVVDTLDGVRRLAVQLGPSILEDLGLRSGLEWLADRVREETGLRVDLDLRCQDERIPSTVAIAVFRVAQEALTNVVRHARASHIDLRLAESGSTLSLDVTD